MSLYLQTNLVNLPVLVNAAAVSAANLENLPALVKGVKDHGPIAQSEYTTYFHRLLRSETKLSPIEQVITSGVEALFVEFLNRDDNPRLQYAAALALNRTWVSFSYSDCELTDRSFTFCTISGLAGSLRLERPRIRKPWWKLAPFSSLFVLLNSPNNKVRQQAVVALGTIAGDSPPCRDLVLQAGAMQPLLNQLNKKKSKVSMRREATWTLSNFCRGRPQPDFELVRSSLPTLALLLLCPDEEVLMDACWALSFLSDGPNEKIQVVIEAGICSRLVELLLHPSPAVQTPALRTVGHIVSGNDLQTQWERVIHLCRTGGQIRKVQRR
jgi:importin subunit alpha-6/7